MVREKINELYLSVPSFFKCPISMNVMRSPVSLCTDVTYDRSSIQQWLDSGHNTCPATMQVLNSTDIVPNLTLRRLIHFWADSDLLCPRSHANFNNHLAIKSIKKLISHEETDELLLDSLLRIVELAKSSEEGREYLANLEGFLPMMARILKSRNEIEVVELVVTALDLILITKGVKDRLKNINFDDAFFSPFSFVLQKGNLDARINTARVLKSLVEFDNDYRREIAEQNGLLNELCRLTSTVTNQTAIDVGLAALIAISAFRPAKKELVRLVVSMYLRSVFQSPSPKWQLKYLPLLMEISSVEGGTRTKTSQVTCFSESMEELQPWILQKRLGAVLKLGQKRFDHQFLT